MMHSHKLRIDGIFHLPNRIFLTSSIISCGEVGALTHTRAHTHKTPHKLAYIVPILSQLLVVSRLDIPSPLS